MSVKKNGCQVIFYAFYLAIQKNTPYIYKKFSEKVCNLSFRKKALYNTLFRDGERARVIGLCLSALLHLSIKMTHIVGFDFKLNTYYNSIIYCDNKKITWLYESRIIYSLLCQCRIS